MPAADPIRIVEVGPRDGLQNESRIVPTDIKVAFCDALSGTGLRHLEVTAFVSPKWVPQLADAELVLGRIARVPGIEYSALVPNEQGLDRALAARVDRIAVFTAASETFSRKNTNASIAETLERFTPVVRRSPVPVRGYVSTAFHCPYEGRITPEQVLQVAAALRELGCDEISIGDTIGKAEPEEVRALLPVLFGAIPPARLALHLHDTYGRAVANARAGYELGIRVFDSSAGGIGGCPFAPGATGNVSTQQLLLEFPGQTTVDAARLDAASRIVRPYLSLQPKDIKGS